MTRTQLLAKQAFERAAFLYGQAMARRKAATPGTQARRDAAGEEDVAETRMANAAAKHLAV